MNILKKNNLLLQFIVFFFLGFIITFPLLKSYLTTPTKASTLEEIKDLGLFNLEEKIESENRSITLKYLNKKDSLSDPNKVILTFNFFVENNTETKVSFCESDFLFVNEKNEAFDYDITQQYPCNQITSDSLSIVNKEISKEVEKSRLDNLFLYFSPNKTSEIDNTLWNNTSVRIKLQGF